MKTAALPEASLTVEEMGEGASALMEVGKKPIVPSQAKGDSRVPMS